MYIPLEIWYYIFNYLTINDKITTRLVCNDFYNLLPLNRILFERFKRGVFIMEHILLNDLKELFHIIKFDISKDEMFNYSLLVFNRNSLIDNYSPDLIKEICEYYCTTKNDFTMMFNRGKYQGFMYSCFKFNRIDVLKYLWDKYSLSNMRMHYWIVEDILNMVISNQNLEMIKWIHKNVRSNKDVFRESLIISALLTNNIDILQFIWKNFAHFHNYDRLMAIINDEIDESENILDYLIKNNYFASFKFIVDKFECECISDEDGDVLIDGNFNMHEFKKWIPYCREKKYDTMADYIEKLYIKKMN
jgi:hypothetical protein